MTEGITMLKLREAAALDLLRYKNGPQPVDLRSMADAQTVIRASRHPMTTTEQERERVMITGYGKGWREPKASGRIARLRQIMREPATTATYYAAGAVFVVSGWAIVLLS